jgi:hypothetical protein
MVDNSPYCYRCAKIIVPQLEQNRKDAASEEYKRRIDPYNVKKAAFEITLKQWNQGRFQATKSNLWSDTTCLIFALVGAFLGISWGVQGFISGGIIAFVLAIIFYGKEHERLVSNFEKRNPQPEFTLKEPLYPVIEPVVVLCAQPPLGDKVCDREAILKRDSYTCQSCGQRKQKGKLEIHHVMPRSQKGANTSCNLITLCLKCHDREDWFGHIRAYPTTLPKRKPLPFRIRRFFR